MKRRDFVTSVMVGGLADPVIGHQQKSGSVEKIKGSKEEEHGHGHSGKGDDRSTNHTRQLLRFWAPTPGAPPSQKRPPATIDRFAPGANATHDF